MKRAGTITLPPPKPTCPVCRGITHLSEVPEAKTVCTVCQLGRSLSEGTGPELQRAIDVTIAHLVHLGQGRSRPSGIILKHGQ